MVKNKMISEGAESHIYSGNLLGIDSIIKYRHEKKYIVDELDSALRTQRTKSEARLLSVARFNGINVPAVLLVSKYSIYIEKINGKTLNEILKVNKGDMPKIYERAGRYLSQVHALDIAHGDYTPANLMVDSKGKVWVIDFGLSVQTNSIEDKALDLLLMKRSINARSYKFFIAAYSKNYSKSNEVLVRLAEIERRGRYQERTMLVRQNAND